MKLKHLINETFSVNNVENEIIDFVLKSEDCSYGEECHDSVYNIEEKFKNKPYYKDLEFIFWDEDKIDNFIDYMRKNVDIKRIDFKNKIVNNLIEDMISGYVNGHSFIKYKDYFIDPYLSFNKVPKNIIQNVDKFIYDIYRNIGM